MQQAYDGSNIFFQFLQACGWGNFLNFGYSRFWDWFIYPYNCEIPQSRLVRKAIALLNPQPHQQILDIACGHGKSSFLIAMNQPQAKITGIDKLPSHIDIARLQHNNTRNLSYLTGDAESLPFDDQSIDQITCIEAAFHFDRSKFLQEVHRVLKPSGRIVIIDFVWKNARSRQVLNTPEGKLCQEIWQFDDFWSIDEYHQAASQLGFNITTVQDWTQSVTLAKQQQMQFTLFVQNHRLFRPFFRWLNPSLNYFSKQDWKILKQCTDAHKPLNNASRYLALVLEKQ
jgi:MPBQ/MSBQ methyltransferase